MCKLVDEKNNRLFCCQVIVISSQTYWSKVYILQIRKTFDRRLFLFLMKKCIHIMNPKKGMSPLLLFILYSI